MQAKTLSGEQMTIRRATVEDLDAVMAIVGETVEDMAAYGNDQWDTTYPNDARFLQDIANETLFVAEDNGVVLGFMTVDQDEPDGYRGLPWRSDEPCLVVHRFAVARRSRNQGVATFLEAAVCRMAQERQIGLIKVDTHSSNTGMQSFLQKKGYLPVGEMEFHGKDRPFFCYDKVV
jgi:ribosomal protein S18 acetylase RimI-like enzyme